MKTIVADNISPENLAMLQSLYSRSADSVELHMDKVAATGAGKFMDNYVVGYNHKSIADCASTTMFIEGVSLLAAKAVQDSPLYCGQETSTRYVDMSKAGMTDPVGTPASRAILDRWMSFYLGSMARVEAHVRKEFPNPSEEMFPSCPTFTSYNRTVKARTFDILRAFLPAGIHTQLSLHSNLRQAGDHLNRLKNHPASEVREVAGSLLGQLDVQYPSSGFGSSLPEMSGMKVGDSAALRAQWTLEVVREHSYHCCTDTQFMRSTLNSFELDEYATLLSSRPRGAVLPHFLTDLGQLQFSFVLDFGSFRDLQRHRNGVCRMPLLTPDVGFGEWYLNQLPPDLYADALLLIREQYDAIQAVSADPVVRQYYCALGHLVQCQVTYGLPAAVYVMELRSSKTVHPTLRKVIHRMIERFRPRYPHVALHADMDKDSWDVRRGSQTIEAK